MSDFVRFHGSGRVNQVQEMSTIKGKPFARLWLGVGGDATKSESVVRVDFWGEDERAQVLALRRGQRALVLGRVSGSVNDKGYWNGTMFGDAVYPDGRVANGGGVTQYAHPAAPAAPAPSSTEASEDIPF